MAGQAPNVYILKTMRGMHESPELTRELDFRKVLTVEFEAARLQNLLPWRVGAAPPEFTTLQN